ncbi:hypothetical protein [Nocardia sp. CNY236]|uniref:hypothetical protein n=1 Tax=Nocardia sp. CNY236 TaxID=1169152 RepID=UPI000411F944|nr:hypothetical protein [Nocardia sp. CNY236]
MPWFQVDDQLGFHPKVVAAGNAAMGLWVRAGSWSMQQLTEGFVPAAIVRGLGSTTQAKKLVDVGLWTAEADGYRFHGWDERQMSKAEIEERRRKRAAAGRKGGQVSGRARRAQAHASAVATGSVRQTRTPAPGPDPGREKVTGQPQTEGDAPPRRCSTHRDHPAPPPCGACADARRARERWEVQHGVDRRAEAIARRDATRRCPMCDDAGWRHAPPELLAANPDPPVLRCDHITITTLDHWHTAGEDTAP